MSSDLTHRNVVIMMFLVESWVVRAQSSHQFNAAAAKQYSQERVEWYYVWTFDAQRNDKASQNYDFEA